MEYEHIVRSFVFDKTFEGELAKYAAEGWTVVPMFPPVVVYHLTRAKGQVVDSPAVPAQAFGAVAKAHLAIDESKMGIRRPNSDGTFTDIPFKVE